MISRIPREVVVSAFWLLLAIYISVESYRLELGSWHRPGPGYFPFGAAVILGMISLAQLLKAVLASPEARPGPSPPTRAALVNVALSAVALYGYVLLLDWLGFGACTLLLMAFLLRVIGRQGWPMTLIASLSITVGAYLLFGVLLNAQLPRGAFSPF